MMSENHQNQEELGQEQPPQRNKIFIGGLHKKTDPEDLTRFLADYATIVSLELNRKREGGNCIGYGSAVTTQKGYRTLTSLRTLIYRGRKITLAPFMRGESLEQHLQSKNSKRIFLTQIPSNFTLGDLKTLFEEIGPVDAVYWRTVPGAMSRIAVVFFYSGRDAVKAFDLVNANPVEYYGLRARHRYLNEEAGSRRADSQQRTPRDREDAPEEGGWGLEPRQASQSHFSVGFEESSGLQVQPQPDQRERAVYSRYDDHRPIWRPGQEQPRIEFLRDPRAQQQPQTYESQPSSYQSYSNIHSFRQGVEFRPGEDFRQISGNNANNYFQGPSTEAQRRQREYQQGLIHESSHGLSYFERKASMYRFEDKRPTNVRDQRHQDVSINHYRQNLNFHPQSEDNDSVFPATPQDSDRLLYDASSSLQKTAQLSSFRSPSRIELIHEAESSEESSGSRSNKAESPGRGQNEGPRLPQNRSRYLSNPQDNKKRRKKKVPKMLLRYTNGRFYAMTRVESTRNRRARYQNYQESHIAQQPSNTSERAPFSNQSLRSRPRNLMSETQDRPHRQQLSRAPSYPPGLLSDLEPNSERSRAILTRQTTGEPPQPPQQLFEADSHHRRRRQNQNHHQKSYF